MRSQPSRILYVNSSGDFHGAERCLLNLTTRLERSEFRPLIVLPFRGQLFDELQRRSVDARILPLGVFRVRGELYPPRLFLRLAELLPAVTRLVEMIRHEDIALVHSNTSGVMAGAIAARISRIPHVWHVREIVTRPRIFWWFMRRLIPRLSHRVICISRAVRQHLGSLHPADEGKIRVIFDGVDVNVPRSGESLTGAEGSGLTVGMIARVNPYKGHEMFIRAAHSVSQAVPSARFVVVGGHLPEYETLWRRLLQLRRDLGLDSALSFTGHQPPERIPEILASFDVFVLPTTDREGLGQVVLEAMAMARPVVATDVGGPCEVVVDGVTGYLVPPSDADRMAAAILRLLRDADLRSRMGRAGRARVEQFFSLDQHVSCIKAVYREVLV